jgi:hypothetical protein
MKGGPGLLSQARWPDTVGIDCDGPDSPQTEDAYTYMLSEFDKANIPYTLHWGKFGNFDAERVKKAYGNQFARWKAVQANLLPTQDDLRLFRSAQLDWLGLTT